MRGLEILCDGLANTKKCPSSGEAKQQCFNKFCLGRRCRAKNGLPVCSTPETEFLLHDDWQDWTFINWAIPGLFFFIFVISIQLIVQSNFTDDWIRTVDLWCSEATALPSAPQPLPGTELLTSFGDVVVMVVVAAWSSFDIGMSHWLAR